ncbi:transcription initiation factor TFIID subunit 1-like, partial [Limulus polyphemus]|uniref:Transcription initiation factor TFIID subunit 1-like n=1 Tax=Limulus polyphemus TaxID=6850 RepID=A0ABM1C2R8_LIMPO
MDSDEEGENEPLSLTGFLFGNIDESGQLENDFLDMDSKRNLHQLNNFGIDSLLKEITEDIDASTQDSQDSEGVETQSSQSDD